MAAPGAVADAMASAGAGAGLLALALLTASAAQAQTLQVLHWWNSTSENKAISLLADRLREDNLEWRDALIPGGSGVGASIVLKSRVLAGHAPEVAQLNGPVTLAEWADLGLLRDLDAVAASGKWERVLCPVRDGAGAAPRPRDRRAARHPPHQYPVLQPQAAGPFESGAAADLGRIRAVAARLHQAGVRAAGAEQRTVAGGDPVRDAGAGRGRRPRCTATCSCARMPVPTATAAWRRPCTRLRAMKKWMAQPLQERAWTDSARQLADGEAAMMVMGDWAKGELNAWGYAARRACSAASPCPAPPSCTCTASTRSSCWPATTADRRAQEKLAQPGRLGGAAGRIQPDQGLDSRAAQRRSGEAGQLRARLVEAVRARRRGAGAQPGAPHGHRRNERATPSSPTCTASSSTTRSASPRPSAAWPDRRRHQ